MSWSTYQTGTKDKVREAVMADLDRCAQNYAGQEEEKDVLMAKDRVLSALDALDTNASGFPAGSTVGVKIEASGSRSGYSVSMSVKVEKVALVI